MAKSKARLPPIKPHVPNPHLYARINFLYQAAQIFSQPYPPKSSTSPHINTNANTALSRFYLSNARTVAKKSVLRLSPALKRSICKRCDALLIPGATSTHRVVNDSRGGRKPWADVLVVECNDCGAVKRFPVGMETKKKDWMLWSERPDVVIGREERKGEAVESQGENAGSQENMDCLVLHRTKELEQSSGDNIDTIADIARIDT